ncbi:DUF6586 family protein [Marinobacter daepoensis]|uniref:DUF6586 family protein n=1 Tax=Marinobacter daepoensis TaxID=262077 RepID=UPI0004A37B0E|nr:DUF6586 family protein [Marinobacter daepoensis]
MASQWHSLVSQKLFLAKTLLARLSSEHKAGAMQQTPAAEAEALTQGAVELMLRARQSLLVMIARHHQNKQENPGSIEALEALFPYPITEVDTLRELSETTGSWWQHLAQLELAITEPNKTRKTVTAENIIAVSADQGPDKSLQALNETLVSMTRFAREIDEQHSEW